MLRQRYKPTVETPWRRIGGWWRGELILTMIVYTFGRNKAFLQNRTWNAKPRTGLTPPSESELHQTFHRLQPPTPTLSSTDTLRIGTRCSLHPSFCIAPNQPCTPIQAVRRPPAPNLQRCTLLTPCRTPIWPPCDAARNAARFRSYGGPRSSPRLWHTSWRSSRNATSSRRWRSRDWSSPWNTPGEHRRSSWNARFRAPRKSSQYQFQCAHHQIGNVGNETESITDPEYDRGKDGGRSGERN